MISLSLRLLLLTMLLVYLVIAALETAALAKGLKECDLANATEGQMCFGELGEPLILHLPTEPTWKTTLKKNKQIILRVRNNTSFDWCEKYKNIFRYFNTGALVVNKTTKDIAGVYRLEIHSMSNGKSLKEINIHIKIQAPVSEPSVSQTCSSAEQMTVNCSAEGEDAELILFLDKIWLMKTKPQRTDNESGARVTLRLHGQLVGNLTCEVHNNISNETASITLTSCKGSTFVAVVLMGLALILLFLLIVFLGVKRLKRQVPPTAVKQDDAQDEIVYSTVQVTQRK